MRCLTEQEIAKWLADRFVTPSPYTNAKSPANYVQFNLPRRPLTNALFIGQLLELTDSEILVHITDWPTYMPAEMIIMDSLRHESKETRNLIDAPGHLFSAQEHELAIALFGHSGTCEWNAYLYLPNDLATLYNWEGESCDFWSCDAAMQHAVESLIGKLGLAIENAE
ncbi:hypothetical protein N9Y42_10505 [Mariniblastus sp.]|nr:hypothetical protein [Mariniblastus sp.]